MTLQDEVKQLAARVPARPEDQLAEGGNRLPAGLTDAEINGFNDRTGLKIPPELREWLHYTNGPSIGPSGVYGIGPQLGDLDMETVFEYLPQFKENCWLPLCTDGCGDFYVLALASEPSPLRPVYFIDAYDAYPYKDASYAVASEFWHFLRFLFRQELGDDTWPFNARAVLASDPNLARVKGAPLPWDT